MLAESIELVGEGSLELLAGDVGELGLGDEGLGLSTDKLLLEDDNLGAVGLLVLELGDLVRDLLLAWEIVRKGSVALAAGSDSRSLLGWTEASMLRIDLMVTRYWSYRSTNWSSSSPIS